MMSGRTKKLHIRKLLTWILLFALVFVNAGKSAVASESLPEDASAVESSDAQQIEESYEYEEAIPAEEESLIENEDTENVVYEEEVIPVGTDAPDETVQIVEEQPQVFYFDDSDADDNDELFAGYVMQVMYEGIEEKIPETEEEFITSPALDVHVPLRESLSQNEKKLYDILKTKITQVANGKLVSTVFTFAPKDVLGKTTFSAAELGLSNCNNPNAVSAALNNLFGDIPGVLAALRIDLPYEMYWYDKTAGTGWMMFESFSYSYSSATISGSGNVTMRVAAAYSKTNATGTTQADKAKTGAASAARTNAETIVTRHASKSDYKKMKAYRDEICKAVEYNYAALGSGVNYGDPWQLIYVFDNDDATDVVCEGYSKAFQLLCDLSDFQSEKTDCISVSGRMAGATGAGGHMWNVITMDDGENYLADITNSDAGTKGNFRLFMRGAPAGTAEGYSLDGVTYTYYGNSQGHDNVLEMYPASKRELSKKEYYPLAQNDTDSPYDASMTPYKVVFDAVAEQSDYVSQEMDILVTSEGAEAVNGLSLTIGGTDAGAFTLDDNGISAVTLAPLQTHKFYIRTKTGLTKKNYTATVTLSGNNMDAVVLPVSFVVGPPLIYEVTFHPGGGTLTDPAEASRNVLYNKPYGTLPTVTRNGCVFDGWYTAQIGGEKVTAETKVTAKEDHTLYAHWIPIVKNPTAKVVFEGKEPDAGQPVPAGTGIFLHSATNGASIYYTTDGTDPMLENGTLYDDVIIITSDMAHGSQNVTIKAIAVKDGMRDSEIVTFSYSLKNTAGDWGDITSEEDRKLFDDADAVPNKLWIAGMQDSLPYTGAAVRQDALRVYHGKKLLEEGTHYTVSYKNNKNAAESTAGKKAPTVTVKGKGNYYGTASETFTITPIVLVKDSADPSEINIEAPDIVLAKSAKEQKGTTTVTYIKSDGTRVTLKRGRDYTLAHDDAGPGAYLEEGDWKVTVRGTGNYGGEIEFTETITNLTPVSKLSVPKLKSKKYTGKPVEIPASELVIKDKGKILTGIAAEEYDDSVTDVDYTYAYSDNTAVGTASVVISGKGNYAGERVLTFKITGEPISKASFPKFTSQGDSSYTYDSAKKGYVYTGEDICIVGTEDTSDPEKYAKDNGFTLYYAGQPLVKGQDYTITYQNHDRPGKATIVYTGIGGYSGTAKKTFKIVPFDAEKHDAEGDDFKLELDQTSYPVTKGGVKPKVTVTWNSAEELTEGTDYTVSYKDNKRVGQATAIVKLKGRFSGTLKETFSVTASDIADTTLSAKDVVFKAGKGNVYKTSVTIYDTDGVRLSAGKDYYKANDKTYPFRYEYAGEVTVENKKTGQQEVRYDGDEVKKDDIIPSGAEIRVIVTGKGNYAGSDASNPGTVSAVYRFVDADIAKAKVKVTDQEYTGEEIRPTKAAVTVTMGGKELKKTDYEIIAYANNIKKGTARLTIRGIGSYGGTKTVSFKIKPKTVTEMQTVNQAVTP